MTRFFLSLAFSVALFAAPPPLSTVDVWAWRTVTDPQIRPDGAQVVYVLGASDRMKDAMYSSLWLAPVDGKPPRPLTAGPYQDTSPRWSPDGTRIAYLSKRSGKPQIRVRWMDTGQEAEITQGEEAPSNIAWSPDGRSIAFLARVPAKPAWSVAMPEKPAGAEWAPPPVIVTRLHWRDDGKGLVPPGNTHLFVVPAEGGAPRQISSGDFDHRGEPAWMPDGRTILLSALRSPMPSTH